MALKRTDSRQWTGEIGQPAPLPYALHRQWQKPLYRYTEAQQRAALPCLLFLAAPFGLLAADGLLSLSIPDLVVAAPNVIPPVVLTWMAGFGLMALVNHDIAARASGWVARMGLVGIVLWSVFLLVTGIQDHRSAEIGPLNRAQIVHVERQGGRRAFRRTSTTLALADGTHVTVRGRPGGRNCYAVRRIEGARGFAWLRIVEAAPVPGAGQLNWPISRETCFSNAPVSSMRG